MGLIITIMPILQMQKSEVDKRLGHSHTVSNRKRSTHDILMPEPHGNLILEPHSLYITHTHSSQGHIQRVMCKPVVRASWFISGEAGVQTGHN